MDRAADDPALRPLIVLRVVIRSPDLETFVNKYSRFLKDDRIFIFTKSSQPPGTRVRFNLELAGGQPLINGEGTVTRIRPDVGDPAKPPGMELRFVPLDEPSQKLVLRMLAARDQVGRMLDQQTAPIVMGTDSQPIAITDRFRDEQTDVDDDMPPPLPPRPPVIESHPVLEPLQKTGTQDAIVDDPRQDESGAVTLAQGGPAGARAPGEQVPSGGYTAPDALPAGVKRQPPPPLPPLPAKKPEERPSGGFSTPTPLPMPIPAGASDEPSHVGPRALAPTRMDRLSSAALDKLTAATSGDEAFHPVGPAPQFAEAFKAPLAGPAHAGGMPPNGTVPANPFSEVSDGAIEYFVEWSLEQSTAPRARAAASSFANVAMATPRAERRRTTVRPLLTGTLLGLLLGVPLGGAAVWLWKPVPLPIIVEQMPQPMRVAPPEPIAPPPPVDNPPPVMMAKSEPKPIPSPSPSPKKELSNKLAKATPALVKPVATEKPALAAKPTAPTEKLATKESAPEKPAVATEKPAAAPEKPAAAPEKPAAAPEKLAMEKPVETREAAADESKPDKPQPKEPKGAATVQIVSHPSGAAISIDGEARGKTPLTLQLPPGTHEVALAKDRYATATQTVDVPGKLDVTLHRPTATLHIDSDPPGGDVAVEGKARGKAPVDVTLEAFHHYDVQVTLLGTKPFRKRIALKPPQVDVNAKLEVVHK